MSHAAVITALKKYTRVEAGDVPQPDLAMTLRHESDRGTIILAATVVDDALTAALKQKLAHLERKEIGALFDIEGGLLATFSNRIKIAQAFGMIDRGTRQLLDLIRVMRNSAAHARQAINFDTKEMRGALVSMMPNEVKIDAAEWPAHQARDIFCLLCGGLADQLCRAISLDAEVSHGGTMRDVVRARVGDRFRGPTFLGK